MTNMHRENEPFGLEQEAMERLAKSGVRADVNVDTMTVVVFTVPKEMPEEKEVFAALLQDGMEKLFPDIPGNQWQILKSSDIESRIVAGRVVEQMTHEEILEMLKHIAQRTQEMLRQNYGIEPNAEGKVEDWQIRDTKPTDIEIDILTKGLIWMDQWLKNL